MTWSLRTPLRSLAASAGRAWAWAKLTANRAVTAAARVLAEAAGVLLGDAVADPESHAHREDGCDRAAYDPDPWDDAADRYDTGRYDVDPDADGHVGRSVPSRPPAPHRTPRASGAIAAGAAAARWWVARRGSAWGAAAVGLLAAAAVLAGGPVGRVAAALAGLAEM